MPVSGAVLDRAVFALSENETAVAVRFGLSNACAGHGALLFEYDDLALFRPQGEDLRLVLQVALEETITQVHCDEDEDDCGGTDTEKYILRRGKHKTRGLLRLGPQERDPPQGGSAVDVPMERQQTRRGRHGRQASVIGPASSALVASPGVSAWLSPDRRQDR